MIAVYVRFDYHGQFRRIDSQAATRLHARLYDIASEYGAVPIGRDHPFVASFDPNSIFWRLQAVEALLAIRDLLRQQFDGTMDTFTVLHSSEDESSLRADMDRAWAALEDTEGVWLSPAAAPEVKGYLSLEPTESGLFSVSEPAYRMGALSMTAQEFYRRDEVAASLSELIGELVVGDEKNVLLVRGAAGTGKESTVAQALTLLGYPADGFLTLRGGTANPRPFDPLAGGIGAELAEKARSLLTPSELALYERLLPAYYFVFASPYRAALSPSMETGYRLFTGLILRSYVREMAGKNLPPIILCENLHRFSPESLDLLGELLVSSEACLLATTAKGAPESWPDYALTEWTLQPPAFEEYAGKLSIVLPESPEDVRHSLFSRARGDLPLLYRCAVLERDKVQGPPPSEAILSLMPQEASAALYAASLCENVLDVALFNDFLERLGLRTKARIIVLDLLRNTGYLSGPGARNSSRMSNRRLAGFVGASADRIEEALAEYLTHLYRNQKITPSMGLLIATQKWEAADRRQFELDCALSDALEDPEDRSRLANRDSPPAIRKLRDLAAAVLSCDLPRAEARLDELGQASLQSTLPPGILDQFRSELAFGRRDFQEAARGAKEALLNARNASVPKTEARAHRILGLCALARNRPEEGIEYFENAQEIASAAHDDYERLVCRWYTALALFTSGRLDKALKQTAQAEDVALRVFRRDWEAACLFLRSRILLELGRYDEARSGFESLRALSRAYGYPETDIRAEIWDARAEAYSGSYQEAEAILKRHDKDSEARFFLAELELLRGNPGKATVLLESFDPWTHGSFDPAEKIFWDSGFRGFERRAFGAASDHPYDADILKAYTLFARGLETRDGSCASDLHRMTREEKLAPEHPAFSVYLYFCFLLLERLQEPPLDKATVLSRAFKYLQERAGRIEDAGCGSDFLEKNLWNRRLVEAARRYKLL